MLSLTSVAALLFSTTVNGYFLMNVGTILQERSDPIVNPGSQAAHVHKIAGGSNFRIETTTSSLLKSECTSTKIKEDKSNYWVPQLYFQWGNGSFTDVKGDFVIYYLYSDDKGKTTPFPEDFRMLSGDPDLRTYDKDSFAQQAVTFLCLDFEGTTSHHDSIPTKICPSGIRSQINFPSCWNGKDTDSPDHKSHVAFPSGGPDSGTCKDPEYPETVPRIFIEHYWATGDFTDVVGEAMNPAQPFVFANGDPTGYGYHGDFVNGWESGTLQKVVDECNCNPYGDPQCCADKGIFTLQSNDDMDCKITHTWDERVKGTLDALPGNNPVIAEGGKATMDTGGCQSAMLDPIYVYKGSKPDKEGEVVKEATCGSGDEEEEESSAVPSSTKNAEPSSTKDAEPSSTKDAEPSSTKDTEPSSTKDAEPSSTEPSSSVEPSSDSAIASPSVSNILIADPTSTPAPEDEEDEDEYCDEDEGDDEESTPSSTPESTPSTPESTPSSTKESTPSSTKDAEPSSTSTPEDEEEEEDCDDGEEYDDDEPVEEAPSSTKEATPSPTDIASPTTQVLINEPSSTASPEEDCDDDDEEYDDGEEEDCEDDEASSVPEPATTSSSPEPATTDASTPTTAILVPSSTPSPSSSEDCDDDSTPSPSISSHSADADTYTIQTADPSTPSPVVAAVNNGASSGSAGDDESSDDSAGSEETCKAGGRRFSYYSKDGSKTKRAATHHHRRRGGHLNRF